MLALDPRESRMLHGLRLEPRRNFAGRVRGERTSVRKGVSIDFADYREYTEGDDLRHLDWNVLARLGHAVVKTYQDEEDLPVHLLVDTSRSMSFGAPTKLEAAAKAALAVGQVALQAGDAVFRHAPFQAAPRASGLRGRAGLSRLGQWLGALDADSPKGLYDAVQAFLRSAPPSGIVLLASDALDPAAPVAVKLLGDRGFEPWLVHVLSKIELDPDVEGDLLLVDSENGSERELTANSFSLESYRKSLDAHRDALAEACRRAGGRYGLLVAEAPLTDFLRQHVRKERWAA